MKNNLLAISILVLSVSIIFSSVWIGTKIENNKVLDQDNIITSEVFTITEVASYLKISEKEVQRIVYSGQAELTEWGTY